MDASLRCKREPVFPRMPRQFILYIELLMHITYFIKRLHLKLKCMFNRRCREKRQPVLYPLDFPLQFFHARLLPRLSFPRLVLFLPIFFAARSFSLCYPSPAAIFITIFLTRKSTDGNSLKVKLISFSLVSNCFRFVGIC